MAKISLVINTCCLGPRAEQTTGSNSKTPHAIRAFLLRTFILPQAIADPFIDEVIVSGEFQAGEGYKYVESPSTYFSCADALQQRHAGFEASTGDVVIFQHDDHLLGRAFARRLSKSGWVNEDLRWAVYSPSRWTAMRGKLEALNNGRHEGYVNGHCAVYKRKVLETFPWNKVPPAFIWDRMHTAQYADTFGIIWAPDDAPDNCRCWDIEIGSEPWK